MKRTDLNNLILEAYAEVLAELNEAPEGTYYIKIPKDAASQNKAQVVLQDIHGINYEINDDPNGVILYFPANKYHQGVLDDLEGEQVEILDTNIPMDEASDYAKRRASERDYQPSKKDAPAKKYKEPKNDYFAKRKAELNESLLDEVEDEEAGAPEGEDVPETNPGSEAELPNSTDIILAKFPTLKQALIKLHTEDYGEFIDSIDWISPRPTSFRMNLKNGQDYILKWTGKTFEAQILGKKYLISKINDFQQALDKLAMLYKEGPMSGAGEGEPFDTDTGGGGGGGGEFPGEEGGAGGGEEDFGGEEGGGEAGGEEGGEDLSGEPIDFEAGEEPEA